MSRKRAGRPFDVQQPVFFNTTKREARHNNNPRSGGSEDSARARASNDEGAKRAT